MNISASFLVQASSALKEYCVRIFHSSLSSSLNRKEEVEGFIIAQAFLLPCCAVSLQTEMLYGKVLS